MRRPSSCLLLLSIGLWSASAEAESPYELQLHVDGPLMLLGAAGSMLALVEVPPAACLPDCSPIGINALDRLALGNYSRTAYTIADVGIATLLLAPLALNLLDSGGDGFLEDTLILGEVMLLNQALTQLVKFAVRRPAPIVYDDSVPIEDRRDREASRSFYSGHTSTAFAAATAYTITFWQRNPSSDLRYVVLGTSLALALAVSVLKVEAGYHFWTDIVAGALAGAGIGALVPLSRLRDPISSATP